MTEIPWGAVIAALGLINAVIGPWLLAMAHRAEDRREELSRKLDRNADALQQHQQQDAKSFRRIERMLSALDDGQNDH